MHRNSRSVQPLAEHLTGREMEVLSLIGDGLTNREISEQMTVAISTVKWYVRQIYNKLGVSSRPEAIDRARRLGLLLDLEQEHRQRLKLPPQHTSFIGRRREIADIRQLLMANRLITLTGPGGSGKTRLAVEVAAASAGQFDDGVFFISLAAVTDPSLVPYAVAQELGITEHPGTPLIDSLGDYFAKRNMLLILDNYEHVLDAAPLVNDLLESAPGLSILVTSREMLHLSGEYEFLVPTLPFPDPAVQGDASKLSRFESVALFVHRAEAVSNVFTFTDDNAPIIGSICSRLDGLPLAIELAAARIKIFSPQQLLERLENRLHLLTSGPRDLPSRQQTLRQTIDWSFELLDDEEQRLFARLAVYSGGMSLKSVEAICCAGMNIDPLDGMESLLNKSLLYRQQSAAGDSRLNMLETVHEYASERLKESGEEAVMRRRHLEYFYTILTETEGKLGGSEQIKWKKRLEVEHDNLMAAGIWSLRADDMLEMGLRIAKSLAVYLGYRDYFTEGRELLSKALSNDRSFRHPAARADALNQAGLLAYMQGDYPATSLALEESLSLNRKLGPEGQQGLAQALITLADMKTEIGEYQTAASRMLEALEIMRELNDAAGEARALWQLGQCAVRYGDYSQAVFYYEKALPVLRQIGDRTSIAIALSGLAEVAIRSGDYDRAHSLEEESYALRREFGDKWGTGVSLGNFAWIALLQGELDQAEKLLLDSLIVRNEIGDKGGSAWCVEKLAAIAATRGQMREADLAERSFQRAAQLFGLADALRAPVNSTIDLVDEPEYERQLALVKSNLSLASFNKAWEEGQSLDLEQLIGSHGLEPPVG